MKKTYKKPAIASKKIEMLQIICDSVSFSKDGVSADQADAKEIFDFFE